MSQPEEKMGKSRPAARSGVRNVDEDASATWNDAAAEWYVEKYGDHPTNRLTIQVVELKDDDVVLDIGCGNGTAVREASERVPRGRVIGVDPTPAMLRIAGEQTASHPGRRGIEYRAGSAARLPVSDESVTVALAINSLHHWDDPHRDLHEVLRVLVPGGRLHLTEEELKGGRFGQGRGALTKPEAVVAALESAGFTGCRVDRHRGSDVRMIEVSAVRPPPPRSPRRSRAPTP